jgi:hypothetical protein
MTIDAHAVQFQFGTAVNQAACLHPVIKALADRKITLSAAITQAPFLDWPAEKMDPWQGTIAAILQKTAKDEGNMGRLPVNNDQSKHAGSRRTGLREERHAAILAFVTASPWVTAPDVGRAVGISSNCASDTLNPMVRERVLTAIIADGHKRYAVTGSEAYIKPPKDNTAFDTKILALLQDGPLATHRIAKAVHADGRKVTDATARLEQAGKIIGRKIPPNGTLWSLRGAKEAAQ